MPRPDPDDGSPTLWEWEVFITVAKLRSWDAATSQLGLKNKYVTERIVRRLATKLNVDRLVVDLGEWIEVPDEYENLVRDADEAVRAVQRLAHHTQDEPRHLKIRFDAYPAHLEAFAGEVIGEFERREGHEQVVVELVPDFGSSRRSGGAGMLTELVQRRTDLVIAPVDQRIRRGDLVRPWPEEVDPYETRAETPERRPLWMMPAQRWALVAAVHKEHPLLGKVIDYTGVLPVSALAYDAESRGPRILASPKGHRSRDLLDLYQTTSRRFDIVETGEEPAALVALGSASERVPVIPSDSYLPAYCLGGLPDHWPAVVDNKDSRVVLGGRYGIFWRETAQPSDLVPLLRRLAKDLHDKAAEIDETLNGRWKGNYRWIDEMRR